MYRHTFKVCLGETFTEKTGKSIIGAFKELFLERAPKALQTDAGSEFKNSTFQKFLKEHNVRYFKTFNATKASVVARFNRTLKTRMWKYFTSKNTYVYIDVLDKLVQSYNMSYHSSIKMAPADVNSQNENQVWMQLYKNAPIPEGKCWFEVGERV